MEITGKIHAIGKVKEYGNNGFLSQDFYLNLTRFDQNTGQEYKNFAKFQNDNEKLDLSTYNEGDIVKIKFSINGRTYEKKDGSGTGFIQSLKAWSIELVKRKKNEPVAHVQEEEEDDLPF